MKNHAARQIVFAFGMAALTVGFVSSANAQNNMKDETSGEKTVMVDRGAMDASKNIIQNFENSQDHTTLIQAMKAAGLANTLEGEGPFTVFAPTDEAFTKLPAPAFAKLLKPENKEATTQILNYHIVLGGLKAADFKDGEKLKTVQGEELTVKVAGDKIILVDAKSGTSVVTTPDVNQSNGVIHIVDSVLMPSSFYVTDPSRIEYKK